VQAEALCSCAFHKNEAGSIALALLDTIWHCLDPIACNDNSSPALRTRKLLATFHSFSARQPSFRISLLSIVSLPTHKFKNASHFHAEVWPCKPDLDLEFFMTRSRPNFFSSPTRLQKNHLLNLHTENVVYTLYWQILNPKVLPFCHTSVITAPRDPGHGQTEDGGKKSKPKLSFATLFLAHFNRLVLLHHHEREIPRPGQRHTAGSQTTNRTDRSPVLVARFAVFGCEYSLGADCVVRLVQDSRENNESAYPNRSDPMAYKRTIGRFSLLLLLLLLLFYSRRAHTSTAASREPL